MCIERLCCKNRTGPTRRRLLLLSNVHLQNVAVGEHDFA